MKRFLSHAIMLCLLGAGTASAETSRQPRTAANQADAQQANCVVKNDVSSKEAKKEAKLARKREKEERKRARREAEPQSSEDAVEMGGGG